MAKISNLQRIYQALWARFRELTRNSHDDKGYVANLEDNLLPGVDPELIRTDFEKGNGNELNRKILAVHSSSALAANTFGFWKTDPAKLMILNRIGFGPPDLEWKPETWFNSSPPNLDVLLESTENVIGIESKFTEPLCKTLPEIQQSYIRKSFINCDDAWWNLLEAARTWKRSYFDVAQVIKHALSLFNTFRDSRHVHLVYLYWAPLNAVDFSEYKFHADDVQKATDIVRRSDVKFISMTYSELWTQWLGNPNLKNHAENLRKRYEITA